MPNYKPVPNSSYITVNALSLVLPTNAKIIVLFDNVALSSAADAMLDQSNANTPYQVTTGKTFNCVGMFITSNSIASSINFSEGDTEDAETILKATINTVPTTSPYEFWINTTFTIASEKFLTQKPAATRHQTITIYGYET